MAEFTLRKVTPAEWQRHRAVRLAMLRESPDAFRTTYAEAMELSKQQWIDRITSNFFLQAWEGDDVVGTIGLSEGSRFGEDADTAMIFAMWVVPSARRSGVGAQLIAGAVDRARRWGKRAVLLDVVETNVAARALYERMGFLPAGVTKPFPHADGVVEIQLQRLL